MNQEEEIKILSYLDNELPENEIKEVEELIESSTEAKDFFEKMKIVNIELANSFNSLEQLSLENRIIKKVPTRRSPIWNLGFSLSGTKSLTLDYAIVGALSVCLTIVGYPYFSQTSISLDTNSLYEKEISVLKFRGAVDQGFNLNSSFLNLEQLIKDLISSDKQKGLFKASVGEGFIEIVINEAFEKRNKRYYFGSATDNEGNSKEFSLVIGEKEEFLYTKP